MSYHLKYRQLILLIMIGTFPTLGWPEIYTSNVNIINGDVARAKDIAIREILNDVGLAGDVELRSATSMVNEIIVQSSLLTSRVKLKEFLIIEENVVGDQFRIKIRIVKGQASNSTCEPIVQIKNVDLILKNTSNTGSAADTRQGIQMFFDGLRESLENSHQGILSRGDYAEIPAYHLIGSIDSIDHDERNGQQLNFKILGANGTTIKAFNYAIEAKGLIVKRREFNGYADLVRRIPSADSTRLIAQASKEISAALRCIPVVARMPEYKQNQIVRIAKVSGEKTSNPALIFYSESFPINSDGSIDLLAIKGNLSFSQADDDYIYLELPKKITGQPYPSPGDFLLLQ